MTTTHRFLVVYRPLDGPPEYYGPFVTERLADEFAADKLPQDAKSVVRPLKARQEVTHDD